ncbi:MAG: tetratricopeptide repeat protein [Thermoanaerobaculia bacterium]|nr:tetratricopeptide repeat protein [Thermoanaerobaculia bacterium]
MSRLPQSGYSTADVARLLGVTEGRVRAFVRAGFVAPGRDGRGRFLFPFQELVVLRTAQGLAASRVPLRRLRRALAKLAEELPRGRSLASVRIRAQNGQVVVERGGEAWEPESGQRLLAFEVDFEVEELARRAAPLAGRFVRQAETRRPPLDAEGWFDVALDLEASAPASAEKAYRRALELEPGYGAAQLNLGRLLHERGEVTEAETFYRTALDGEPHSPTAAFNLGVALQDLGRLPEAARAYRRALDLDPRYADAHFNLAGVHEQQGQAAEAIRHLREYRWLVRR